MFKKSSLIWGIFGLVFFVIGIVFNLGLLIGEYSEWKTIKSHLFGYYAIIIGLSFVVISVILRKVKTENKSKFILLSLVFLGVISTCLGIIFSPSFSVEHFVATNFLSEDGLGRLLEYQIITLTIGCLLVFIPLVIFCVKYLQSYKWLGWILIPLGFIFYFILIQVFYVNVKYPSNIVAKTGEYKKVLDLLLGQDILLSDFDPQATLKVNRKKIIKAKYPVIDVNAHLSSAFSTDYDKKVLAPENLIKSMDSVGLQMIFNTDVEGGDLEKVLNTYSRKYPNRFRNLWPTGFPSGIMSDERLAELPGELEKAVKMGVVGEGELWKYLGVKTKDQSGKVLAVDDVRIDPFWAKAGELGVPILWHMGDPASMFQPIDRFNERYIELRRYPDWSFFGPEFPSRETIMKGRENVLRKHPETIIIGCHMGWNCDNLDYAGYLLDTYPNYYLDMSTTLSELGRQPYTTRKFFIKYQDRIVFGTDGGSLFGVKGWTVEKFYQAHWEFLETENEYIDYPMQGAINQGSWKIYGINLPDTVLQKIYYKNAAKLFKIKLDINPQ